MAAAVKTKSTALITILVVILILIVVNLLSLNLFSRVDLTENRIYTISNASRHIIGGLDDRLTVKVFFTRDLPAPHGSDKRYLQDILADFKAYSGGKMFYEFIDPQKDEDKSEARSYNIPEVRFDVLGSSKAESILGYKGIVLTYGAKSEKIPFLGRMNDFEYDFIRLVKKLMSPKRSRIGFIAGHGEYSLTGELTVAKQLLGEDFEVVPIDITRVSEIPLDVKALMIVSPQKEYTERDLYVLDQYIMRGGRVGFFINSFNQNPNLRTIEEVKTGLDPLLNHYGIGINRDFVIDKNCLRYTDLRKVEGGFVPVNVEIPFFVNITKLNENSLLTKYQSTMALIGSSSLDTSMQVPSGVSREILFTSSEKAGTVSGDLQSKLSQVTDKDYTRSLIPMGAVLMGKFNSYFADRFIPQPDSADTSFIAPSQERLPEGTLDSRIIVVGNGNCFDDPSARDREGRFRQNFVFFRNVVDWLAQDDDLIAIRSKGNLYTPFTKVLSEQAQTTVKLINILAMPLLVIIFGLLRWQVKRAARRRLL